MSENHPIYLGDIAMEKHKQYGEFMEEDSGRSR